jgi:hypothetical protein
MKESAMTENPLHNYHGCLSDGHTYRFPNWQENGRVATVTAKQSAIGRIWLLYEHVGDALDLRYWVMPDGGISLAKERGSGRMAALNMLPPLANVRELEDMTDGLDPELRREIEEILRKLDAGRHSDD